MSDIDEDFTVAIGTPGGNRVTYDIWADGFLELFDSDEPGDVQVTDYHAKGVVNGGWDTFGVKGTISDLRIDTPPGAVTKLNGERVPAKVVRNFIPERQRDSSGTDDSQGSSPPSVYDPPESAPGQASLGPTASDVSLGGGTYHEIPKGKQDPQDGIVSRYETSVEPIHLTIDENEKGAFQSATNRLPKEPKHDVTIALTDGYHGGNGSAVQTGFIRMFPKGHVSIESKSGDRDRCVSESGVNSVAVGKLGHYRYNDIAFENLSQFSGPVRVQGCAFEGFDEPGANSDSTSAISGKNALAFLKDCRIGSGSDDYGIHSIQWEMYAIYGSRFDARKMALRQQDACLVVSGWGNTSGAPKFAEHEREVARGAYAGGHKVW